MMKRCTFTITGVSPYGQSKAIQSIKGTGENHDAFEERTWRERMHVDEKGEVFIPPMAIKNCLSEVAKYLCESVPGKKGGTYTKYFEAGILCVEPGKLGIKAKDVNGLRLFVPSDGKRGGGKRVWKTFPVIPSWSTQIEVLILDPILMDKPEKIKEYIEHAGKIIGIGFFRPRNNGYFGRFEVSNFKCVDVG